MRVAISIALNRIIGAEGGKSSANWKVFVIKLSLNQNVDERVEHKIK
jgi:hypothetical protein